MGCSVSRDRSRSLFGRSVGALVILLALWAGVGWAQNTLSAFALDESVAHFNRETGEFWAPEDLRLYVDYNYTGNKGTPVFVGVSALSGGSEDIRFGYGPHRIDAAGRGQASVRLSVVTSRMPLLTIPVAVDRLQFEMYKGGQEPFLTWATDVRLVFTIPFNEVTRNHIAALEPPSGTGADTQTGAGADSDTTTDTSPFRVATPVLGRELRLPSGAITALLGRRLSDARIRIQPTAQHLMFAGKTNEGRYFVVMAEQRSNFDLVLRRWKVFAPSGAVHRQGTNTVIQPTYTLDFDSGSTSSGAKDLWWEAETATQRYLTPRNGARLALVYASRSNFPVNAPPTKRIFLEVDKILGAEWPPYVVERGGAVHSLPSIYANANIDLVRRSHQGNIPDLKNGEAYSDADLDSLFSTTYNASTPSGFWHMQALMVTRYRDSGVLGVMYRTSDRRGFAVFTKAFSGSDASAYMLRTTAHELGHALNLFHSDGDANSGGSPVAGRGRTIMNQTWTLASDWGYNWHANELDHLNNHPVNRIQPNTGHGFNQCISSHRAQY